MIAVSNIPKRISSCVRPTILRDIRWQPNCFGITLHRYKRQDCGNIMTRQGFWKKNNVRKKHKYIGVINYKKKMRTAIQKKQFIFVNTNARTLNLLIRLRLILWRWHFLSITFSSFHFFYFYFFLSLITWIRYFSVWNFLSKLLFTFILVLWLLLLLSNTEKKKNSNIFEQEINVLSHHWNIVI